MTVGKERVSELKSSDFRFSNFKESKYSTNTRPSFYKDVKIFELNPEYPSAMVRFYLKYPMLHYLNYFKYYNYKMRKIDDVLQITCYSKNQNRKSVVILDEKTLLPKAVYQITIAPSYGTQMIYGGIEKKTNSVTSYDMLKDEATILYKVEGNNISIAEMCTEIIQDNYKIRRTNKQGKEVFAKDLDKVVSSVSIKKNAKIH